MPQQVGIQHTRPGENRCGVRWSRIGYGRYIPSRIGRKFRPGNYNITLGIYGWTALMRCRAHF